VPMVPIGTDPPEHTRYRRLLQVALEEWHRRIPEYELAPGTTPRATWPAGLVGIDSLPVVFPAGGGGGR